MERPNVIIRKKMKLENGDWLVKASKNTLPGLAVTGEALQSEATVRAAWCPRTGATVAGHGGVALLSSPVASSGGRFWLESAVVRPVLEEHESGWNKPDCSWRRGVLIL